MTRRRRILLAAGALIVALVVVLARELLSPAAAVFISVVVLLLIGVIDARLPLPAPNGGDGERSSLFSPHFARGAPRGMIRA